MLYQLHLYQLYLQHELQLLIDLLYFHHGLSYLEITKLLI